MTSTGAKFDCEIAVKRVETSTRNRNLFTIVARDITDRKRVEKQREMFLGKLESMVSQRTRELESSQAFLAAVLDSTVDGILTVDAHGVIQSLNKSANHLLGYVGNDLLGLQFSDLLHESHRPGFLQCLNGEEAVADV